MVEREIRKGDMNMAYWLYCQACKEWSRSATPLSEDKACKYCGTLLTKTRGGGSSGRQADDAEMMESPKLVQAAEVETVQASEPLPETVENSALIDEIAEEVELQEEKIEDAVPEEEALTKETPEDSGEAAPADNAAGEEDEEPLEDGEEESSQENDVVKVSEVRVITDKNEKKERLAKKRH